MWLLEQKPSKQMHIIAIIHNFILVSLTFITTLFLVGFHLKSWFLLILRIWLPTHSSPYALDSLLFTSQNWQNIYI